MPYPAMRLNLDSLDSFGAVGIPEDQPLPPEDRAPAACAPSPSLDDLYRTQAPRLLRYFRSRTGNAQTASDLVQDAFARLAGCGGFSELLNPAAYLQRIARNLLVDRSRRLVVREALVPLEDLDGQTQPTQEDELLAQDLLRRYEMAIAALPERTRMIFLLKRSDDMTYHEIADHLGVRLFTVQYHMRRAIAHLDRTLNDR